MEKQRNDLAVLQKNGLIHLIGKSENRIPEPKFKGGTVPWFDDTKPTEQENQPEVTK